MIADYVAAAVSMRYQGVYSSSCAGHLLHGTPELTDAGAQGERQFKHLLATVPDKPGQCRTLVRLWHGEMLAGSAARHTLGDQEPTAKFHAGLVSQMKPLGCHNLLLWSDNMHELCMSL